MGLSLTDINVPSATELPRGPGAPPGAKFFALTVAEAQAIPIYVSANITGGPPAGVTWTGGQSAAQPEERLVLSKTPGKFVVTCTLGGVKKTAVIYVVGATQTDFRGDGGGTFHSDNIASLRRADGRTFSTSGRKTGRNTPSLGSRIDFNDFCETQYTVEPAAFIADGNAGQFNKANVKFIVRREKWVRSWVGDVASSTWAPSMQDTSWTDDTDAVNSMLNPWGAQGHLYSSDGPGLINLTMPDVTGIVLKYRLRQQVHATFDGTDPMDGHGLTGLFFWHDFRSLHKPGSSVMWMETSSFGGNELVKGDKDWGTNPT